jgi:protoporphyrinogen oxidase
MGGKSDKRLDTNQRIAILGAGAAGLTAAEALKRKGYKHVTVFERTDHAGGKCLSEEMDSKSYELGACVLTKNNTVPLHLAEKYKVPIEQANFDHSIIVDKNGNPISEGSFILKLKILWQLIFRYRPLLKRYKSLESPGFHNIEAALCIPFEQFAKENKITDLADVINLFLTGFGYSYTDRISTAYVLKYMNWKTICAYIKKDAYIFPKGIQGLWTRVAKEHDVRFNAMITKISRADTVIIETKDGKEEFDTLILTTPLDETSSFMDLSAQEEALFKKIVYLDYQTILCTLKNFPATGGYIPDNFTQERSGHPLFWYHRQAKTAIFSFYVLADENTSKETVQKNLRGFVRQMGGEIETIHKIIRWKYFPHVDAKPLRDGFYDKLEKMQGKQHTYYAGELLSFACVGFTSEYAETLVNQNF